MVGDANAADTTAKSFPHWSVTVADGKHNLHHCTWEHVTHALLARKYYKDSKPALGVQ